MNLSNQSFKNKVTPTKVTLTSTSSSRCATAETTPLTSTESGCKVEKNHRPQTVGSPPPADLCFTSGVLTLESCSARDSHLRNTDCLYVQARAGIAASLRLLCHTPRGRTDRCSCEGAADCINSRLLPRTAEVIVTHAHTPPSAASGAEVFTYR